MSDQLSLQQQNEEIERKRQEEELQTKLELIQLKELKEHRQRNDEKEETPEDRRKRQKEEFERQQHETEEEKETRIEREVRELEEKFNLPHLPQQRHQPNTISELTLEQHDQLLSFILSTNDRMLRYKVCQKLPIVDIIDEMEPFVPQKYIMKIKETGGKHGNHVATERFLSLAITKKLKIGWSHQFIQTVTDLNENDVEKLIRPKQADLEEFYKRAGIPRNSLLDQLTDKLRTHCGFLTSPMGKDDKDSDHVPVVHPEMVISENHFKENSAFTDGTYKPLEAGRKPYKYAPRISFNDVTKSNVQTTEVTNKYEVLLRKHHGIFLFLIGPAGSGKTTLTRRMVKAWIKEKKMAFLIPFAQIDPSERLRLKDLLTTFLCRLHNLEHDPSEEEIDEAFHWILANQDKCMLVFDGLDQAGFEISKEFIEADINDELMPCDLLALILSRRFLPGIRLVLSTRPHSIASLVPATQPQIVVFLNDLLSNDVEKLMNYYLQQHGTAGGIMEKLRMKLPRIYQLIFTPLFLRFVVMLNNEVGEDIWTYVNTTAKLFYEIIDRLQMSVHHECGLDVDVEVLNDKLGEMAFHKTMERSVVFTQADLERHDLNGDNIQDFLFGVMQRNTALLVGLNKEAMIFFFNHQSTQEYFSAKFALEKLAVREFKELVGKIIPPITLEPDERLHLGEDFFGNLRVLVGGCINELEYRAIEGDEVLTKKNVFITSLSDHLRKIFTQFYNEHGVDSEQHQKQILLDLLDIRKDGVTREIRQILSNFNFVINFVSLDIAHRESLFHFLEHFISKVQLLSLNITRWSEDEIQRLFQAIRRSTARIEKMDIEMDERLPYVNEMIEIFPHLTRNLELRLNGYDDDDRRRQFCRSMEEEINNFDTSRLQTQELEVKIIGLDGRTLLHVVIRRGESPQFITSEY